MVIQVNKKKLAAGYQKKKKEVGCRKQNQKIHCRETNVLQLAERAWHEKLLWFFDLHRSRLLKQEGLPT